MLRAIPLLLISPCLSAQDDGKAADQPRPARSEVGQALSAALGAEKTDVSTATPARVARLQAAAEAAASALPAGSLVAERLRGYASGAVAEDERTRAEQLSTVRARLQKVASDLGFEPVREAPVPVDWPKPAPVGDVVVKEYPTYRMARSPMRGGGDMAAFWTLFRHIQSNDIPMTAPVQMDHATAKPGDLPERSSMAFLYESAERGRLGSQGNVEVVDVPAATWVSIGARGYETADSVDELLADLRRWLAANSPRYEVVGPMRVMGWNGPSVRRDRRFYEVELPIRLRRDA